MLRRDYIEKKLSQELLPDFLNVEDESQNHHVPVGAQTHFKVTAVSPIFIGLTHVTRHRLVNKLLLTEFEQGLHALSLHLYTPEEWATRDKKVLTSPSCKDGFKNKV
jgi:BolA protein